MIDFGLKPCPLCGGEARVESLSQGRARFDATICCSECGLELNWSTEFVTAVPLNGEPRTILKRGLDPFEAWNRRIGEKGEIKP